MDPDGAVRAPEGDSRSVGRKGNPEQGVLTDGDRAFQLAGGNLPELQLPETGRRPTPRHQSLPIRGKGQRLDAIGKSHQAALQTRPVRAVQQDLPIPRNGQQGTVRRVGQGRNHGRRGVDRRLLLRNPAELDGRVVGGAPLHPGAELADDLGVQRWTAQRHQRRASAFHHGDQQASLRIPGDQARTAVPSLEKGPIPGEVEVPLLDGRLVATLAVPLDHRPDVPEITGGGRCLLLLGLLRSKGDRDHHPGKQKTSRDPQGGRPIKPCHWQATCGLKEFGWSGALPAAMIGLPPPSRQGGAGPRGVRAGTVAFGRVWLSCEDEFMN